MDDRVAMMAIAKDLALAVFKKNDAEAEPVRFKNDSDRLIEIFNRFMANMLKFGEPVK